MWARSLGSGGWSAVGFALLAGLLLRLWFLWHWPRVAGDSLIYGDIARNMLEHHVYGFTEIVRGVAMAPRPTLIRLPGYPLFLALCFRVFGVEHYKAVLILQIAVDLWTCLLLGGVAARIFGRRAGLAAVWLGALCPFTANYAAAALTETLTLFCMGLAFYAVARWGRVLDRWVFVLGFALAFAVLLRPEQGMLAAAVVPAMVWMAVRHANQGVSSRLKSASLAHFDTGKTAYVKVLWPVAVVAVLTVLPLLPWAARNWHTFRVFQPLAPRFANDPGEANPDGFQRWYRTWAMEFASTENVYWNYDGSAINVADLPRRAFDSRGQLDATTALLAEYNEGTTATPELDRRFDAIALERIHADPLRYHVALPLGRVLNMMLRPRTEMLPVPLQWWKFEEHRGACALASAFGGLNLVYFVLAGVVLARPSLWRGTDVLVWSMVATMGLRAALLLTLDNSEPRYTLEFYPVLIVLGAGLWPERSLSFEAKFVEGIQSYLPQG